MDVLVSIDMRNQYKVLAEKYQVVKEEDSRVLDTKPGTDDNYMHTVDTDMKEATNTPTLPLNVEGGMKVQIVMGLDKTPVPVYEMWVQDGTLMIAIDELRK